MEAAWSLTQAQQSAVLAVLASLPALTFSARAAAVGAVAKGGTTAKATGLAAVLGAMLGPLVVFLPNYLAYRVTLAGAYSDEERAAGDTATVLLNELQPHLDIGAVSGDIRLTWAAWASFHLESTTNLSPSSWTLVVGSPLQTNGLTRLTLPVGVEDCYFRLRQL